MISPTSELVSKFLFVYLSSIRVAFSISRLRPRHTDKSKRRNGEDSLGVWRRKISVLELSGVKESVGNGGDFGRAAVLGTEIFTWY